MGSSICSNEIFHDRIKLRYFLLNMARIWLQRSGKPVCSSYVSVMVIGGGAGCVPFVRCFPSFVLPPLLVCASSSL